MANKKKITDKVDKRYRARVQIPGTDKAIWVSGKTKKELAEKVEEAKSHLIYGEKVDDVPFVDMITRWFETVKLPAIKSPSTRNGWKNTLKNHVLPCFDARQMCRAVTRADLQDCLDQTAGLASITGVQVKAILCGTCKYALIDGIINRDPSTMLVKPEPKDIESKDILTDRQETAILNVMRIASREQKLLFALLYYTGVRRGEAIALRWGDVEFSRNLIHIERDADFNCSMSSGRYIGKLKSKASDRYIPILPQLYSILQEYRGLPNQYVITGTTTPLNKDEYALRSNEFLLMAGLAVAKETHKSKEGNHSGFEHEITAHYLRHHFVSSCMIAGVRPDYVKLIAGHANINTTLNVYTHILRKGELVKTQLSGMISKSFANSLPEHVKIASFFK